MSFYHQAAQCEPLAPVPGEKSELNAAKAMEQITKGQGTPPNPHPVNVHYHGADFTAPRS
jgi:hypothetical protein